MENLQEKEFRQTVLSLSDKLTKKDTNNIVYLYQLPKDYQDREPLTVLELMQNRDLFSAAKPDGLAKLLKEIHQDALVKIVEKYKKSRKGAGKCQVTMEAESDPSLTLSLHAKFEVTRIQSVITATAVKQSLEMVKKTPFKRVSEIVKEANDMADKLCALVKHAQAIYYFTNQQPSQRGIMPGSTQPCMPRGDDDNDIYEDTTASTPTNAPCDYEYMCSTSVAREIQQQADVTAVPPPGAQMVTGVSRKQETKQGKPGTKLERPAVFPKPSKGATCGTRASPSLTPQQPAIGVHDIQKRKATLKKSSANKSQTQLHQQDPQSSTASDVESDCTGGSYTEGDNTEDSGVGDVRQFLKVKIPGQPTSHTYYTKLGTMDVVDGYTTVTRVEEEDDLYECLPDLLDEGMVAYVNVPKTLK